MPTALANARNPLPRGPKVRESGSRTPGAPGLGLQALAPIVSRSSPQAVPAVGTALLPIPAPVVGD